MPDLSIYKVNLDTPQPDGRKGESPRVAFTKYNDLVSFLEDNTGAVSSLISDVEPTEWIDTSTNPAVIKRRNRDNTSWLTIGSYEKPLTDFVEKVADKGLSTNDYTNEDKQIVGGVTQALEQKVDKVVGKGLSTNDYTNEDKQIVGGVTQALEQKVDKVVGKDLSTNDYSNEDKALVSIISGPDLAWLSMPIGFPFPLFGELPPTNNAFRYVVLTDEDPYNDGVLFNKEVSGTAPNLVIKYTIDMPDSPLNGMKIEMVNTMESIISPSVTNGKVFQDTIRNITGRAFTIFGVSEGALQGVQDGKSVAFSGNSNSYGYLYFDASKVVPTGNRNQTFALGIKHVMRIK
ncbi:TPA: hypothetical protein I7566_04860 [Vibrio cholerae]|nr:hypothetical protein [Vibrio cholerae]HAS7885663.1 hypothetical protein [Vibrio cholerae]HAS8038413.1 hypothetical protein [Vibrio cholerae]HAS8075699.1 hypothetical protein [Vibrio cholerae]